MRTRPEMKSKDDVVVVMERAAIIPFLPSRRCKLLLCVGCKMLCVCFKYFGGQFFATEIYDLCVNSSVVEYDIFVVLS